MHKLLLFLQNNIQYDVPVAMQLIQLRLLLYTITLPCYSLINPDQHGLIAALCNEFNIRSVIVINDRFYANFKFAKYLSANQIFVKYLTVNEIKKVTRIYEYPRTYHPKILLLFDEDDPTWSVAELFKITNEHFLPYFLWVVIDKEIVFENMTKLYVPYNCQFFSIEVVDSEFNIYEIYHRLVYSKKFTRNYCGRYSENNLQIFEKDLYKRRFDMNGTQLVIVDDYYPYRCWTEQLCAYEGMIKEMMRMMNFKPFRVNMTELDRLQRDDVDIAYEVYIGLFVFDAFFYKRDMIAPIWRTPAFLHIRHEKIYEEGYAHPFTQPYTTQSWLMIGVLVLLLGSVIIIINYWNYIHRKFLYFHFTDGFMALDAFMNQCGNKISKSASAHISLFTARAASLFVSSLYSAVIISFVAIQAVKLPFTNLEGLIKDGTFKIGYENDTIFDTLFKLSEPPWSIVSERKLAEPVENKGMGRKICNDPKLAIIYFNDLLWTYKPKCEILQIPTPIFISWDAVDLRPNSTFRTIFNRLLKTFFSSGLVGKWEKIVYGNKPPKKAETGAIKFQNTSRLFILITFIYLFAISILILECMYDWTKSMKKKKMKNKKKKNRRLFVVMVTRKKHDYKNFRIIAIANK